VPQVPCIWERETTDPKPTLKLVDVVDVESTADIEVRGTQNVSFQTRKPLRIRLDRHPLEEARQVGVCDDLLDVSVAAFRVRPFNAVSQARWHALNAALQILCLLMKEGLTISKQKLDVPHLGHINGRVIDLRNDTIPDGKPDPSREGSSSTFAYSSEEGG
jgi:hypothetical protein